MNVIIAIVVVLHYIKIIIGLLEGGKIINYAVRKCYHI